MRPHQGLAERSCSGGRMERLIYERTPTAARSTWLAVCLLLGSAPATAQIPRTADGKPDLSGIWQAVGTAHWDLQDHAPQPPALYQLGAVGAVPGGRGVVQDDTIPYQPWAAEKKRDELRATDSSRIPRSSATCPACRGRPTCRSHFKSSRHRATFSSLMSSPTPIARSTWASRPSFRTAPGWVGRTAVGKAIRSSSTSRD